MENTVGLGRQVTDKQRIKAAFSLLRELGFFARMNFSDCQSCGKAAIAVEHGNPDNLVFYHNQSNAYSFPKGAANLEHDLPLHWNGDGETIRKALEAAGLTVEWNGSPNLAIVVKKVQ